MSSRLDEIKDRAAAATCRPWKWVNRRVPTLNGMAGSRDVYRYETEVIEADHNGECGCRSACQLDLTVGPADAEFIAHARTDVPVLVAAVEAAMYAPREVGHDLYMVSLDYQNGYNTALDRVSAAIRTALGEEQ